MYRAGLVSGPGVLATLVLALAVAGCGTASVSGTAQATTTTPFPTATATATATATPKTEPVASACGGRMAPDPSVPAAVQIGDLYVLLDWGLAYPSRKLPDNTPLAPFKVQDASGAELDQQIPADPATNPFLKEPGGGFVLTVCNASPTQAHTLQAVAVRIDSFTAYSGQLNQWNLCDGAYARTGLTGGGCGGALFADEYLHATFASATVGASVTAAQTGTGSIAGPDGPKTAPLPVSLTPNHLLEINLGLTLPSAPGTYAFSYALTVDGALSPFKAAMGRVLLAPVAHKWGGQACMSATMQSQIPAATNPPTYYICPA